MSAFKLGRNVLNINLLNCSKYGKSQNFHITRYAYSTNSKPQRSTLKLSIIGATVGVVIGSAYSGYNAYAENRKTPVSLSHENKPFKLEKMPDYQATRQIKMLQDKTKLKLVLFQYQTCPFCCKVRAFLDYYGFSYDVVEVDAVLRQSIRWSKYKKVPILVAKSEEGYYQLNDSSMIISLLASYMCDSKQTVSELVNYYPTVEMSDEAGNKKSDIMNKYNLMFQDKKSKRSSDDVL